MIYKSELSLISSALDKAQSDIMHETYNLEKELYRKVNPNNIKIIELSSTHPERTVSIWEAILLIVSESRRVWGLPLYEILPTNKSVHFVLFNAVNGVLEGIQESTSSIEQFILDQIDDNQNLGLIIYITATIVLGASTLAVIPLLNKVKGNKQEVLKLFLFLSQSIIEDQLNKCKSFLTDQLVYIYIYIYIYLGSKHTEIK